MKEVGGKSLREFWDSLATTVVRVEERLALQPEKKPRGGRRKLGDKVVEVPLPETYLIIRTAPICGRS